METEKTFCVYFLKHISSGKTYIGSSTNVESRLKTHITSLKSNRHINVLFQKTWNESADNTLSISKVYFSTEKEIRDFEVLMINKLIARGCLFNIILGATGGDSRLYHPNREEIILRSAIGTREHFSKLTTEQKKLMHGFPGERNPMYGKTHTEAAKAIISATHKSKPNLYMRNRIVSQSTRDKMSQNAKLRVGHLNTFFGKKHTDEYKKRMSDKKSGIPNLRDSMPISVNGVAYTSCAAASKILGIYFNTIRHRVSSKNKKFDSYFYLPKCQTTIEKQSTD